MMDVGSNFAFKTAAKPQLLLTVTTYRNSSPPYPMVSSPTPYDIPFSHNTKYYRRQTTDTTLCHRSER